MRRFLTRALPAAVAVAGLVLGLSSSPASAFASPVVVSPFVDVATGLSGHCSIAGGVATTTYVEYAIDGTATASGGVALSTGVTCTVKTNYGVWGSASGGAPGPVAVAAGTVRIPVWALSGLRVCAKANALYSPNTPRSYTQPNC